MAAITYIDERGREYSRSADAARHGRHITVEATQHGQVRQVECGPRRDDETQAEYRRHIARIASQQHYAWG